MLIMSRPRLLFAPFNSGKHIVTGFGNQHVILDPRAPAALGNVYSGLNRDHHTRLKHGGFSGEDQKTRIVIAEPNVVAGVMSKERRESFSSDLIPCQRVDVASGNVWTDALDRGLLRISDN